MAGLHVQVTQAADEQVIDPANIQTSIVLTIGSQTYTKNGESLTLDVPAYIAQDNRTMVPIRFITDGFGAITTWDDTLKRDTILFNGIQLEPIELGSLPNNMGTVVLKNDRLFVPIRYVSMCMGALVSWNAQARTVTLSMLKDGTDVFPVRMQEGYWYVGGGDFELDGVFDKGFSVTYQNISTNDTEVFKITDFTGDSAFYPPYFSGTVVGFNFYTTSVQRSDNFNTILDRLRTEVNQSYRVYINGERVTGKFGSSSHVNNVGYSFIFDRTYDVKDIQTIRIELGLPEN